MPVGRWVDVLLAAGLLAASAVQAIEAADAGGAERADFAIVAGDSVPLRNAPRESASVTQVLWPGELLEVRGEHLGYFEVFDALNARGGFVREADVRRHRLSADHAAELLAIVRFLRDRPGSESLGIGYAMAHMRAIPADSNREGSGAESLAALGQMAERLAARASAGAARSKAAAAALAGHLDVAARHGVRFNAIERNGRMQVCYDGEAHRRVLSLRPDDEYRAHAVLALTRGGCFHVVAEQRLAEQHADWLDLVDVANLPGPLANRVELRRAIVWSRVAFERALRGERADGAARRAMTAFASVRKSELAAEDAADFNDAAMRASAVRWATVAPLPAAGAGALTLKTVAGAAGETCIVLGETATRAPSVNATVAFGAMKPVGAVDRSPALEVARQCTFGLVWTASAQFNREQNAVAIAVQPSEAWLELWIFRKEGKAWTVRVLPPAATAPHTGYAEWAGWIPGGARMLVAREARGEGRYRRRFEVVRLDSLAIDQEARDPERLDAFQRWQSAAWRAETLSVR